MNEEKIDKQVAPALTAPVQSDHEDFPRWGTTRLRVLFLVPMAIAIITIVLVLSLVLFQQTSHDVRNNVIRTRTSVESFFKESIRNNTHVLLAVMYTLSQDEKISAALAQLNREALLQYTTRLFDDIMRDFHITHLYFTGTDRVNLLRVHAPLRHGDVIERFTTLQAEKSGSTSHGVELGPLGTFTLRLVAPWYDRQTHKLIGYVELGMEIDEILNNLPNFFGMQVFTVIKKEFLDRSKWEAGMRTLGRTPNWEYLPNEVANEQSLNNIPSPVAEYLARGEFDQKKDITELVCEGFSYRVTAIPLLDADGRAVAQMILVANVSEMENAAYKTVYRSGLFALVLGTALFVFFYWLVGRIGQRIENNEKELRELAIRDGLTGLYNHRYFYNVLENEIAHAQRYHHPMSLLLIDIDHFKQVNDIYGHRAGDAVLRDLSKRLTSRMRSVDRVCRYGGEEITVILPETDITAAKKLAEDLRILIERKPFELDGGQSTNITISIGLTTYPEHAETASLLVSHADTAMYGAKNSGRNLVNVYHPKVASLCQ